jgi:peptidoglycan/LPS O-acetylase OafA/YrhL
MRLARFRRVTTSGCLIPEIDGLRFIAIASVIILHVSGGYLQRLFHFIDKIDFDPATLPAIYNGYYWIFRLQSHGGRGVEIFFVISGFILGWPFARQHILGQKRVNLGQYYIRRLTRLEPPYVLSLLMRTVLLAISGLYPVAVLLPHLFASLFYAHNFVYHASPLVSVVAWSLEIEIQFYCLAPIMAWLFKIPSPAWRRLTLLALIGLGAVVRPAFGTWIGATLLGYWPLFLVGFLLADLFVSGMLDRESWLFDLAIPVWFLVFWLTEPVFWRWGPALLLGLFFCALRGRASKAFLRFPVVSVIGGMCYSLYLTHMGIAALVMPKIMLLHQGVVVSTALALIPVLFFGVCYFLLIERPCMDKEWPQKLWKLLSGKKSNREAEDRTPVRT